MLGVFCLGWVKMVIKEVCTRRERRYRREEVGLIVSHHHEMRESVSFTSRSETRLKGIIVNSLLKPKGSKCEKNINLSL